MFFTTPPAIVSITLTVGTLSVMASTTTNSRRVGVMRFSALGDLAAALPVLRAIHPVPTIITSQLGRELLQDEFDDFIILADKSWRAAVRCVLAMRARHFDCLIDLQCNDRSRILRAFASRGTVLSNRGIPSPYPVTRALDDIARPSGYLKILDTSFTPKPKNYIVINAGSSQRWESKRLPLGKWTEISRVLHNRFGLPFRLTGAQDEREYIEKVATALVGDTKIIAGTTSLPELKHILAKAWLTVSTDSGPMHLSAVMKTPTIGLFGPTNWVRSAPFGPWSVALYDRTVYPTGVPPTCSQREPGNFFSHIDIIEGLERLAEYLR